MEEGAYQLCVCGGGELSDSEKVELGGLCEAFIDGLFCTRKRRKRVSEDDRCGGAGTDLERMRLSPRTRLERIWVTSAVTSGGTTTSDMLGERQAVDCSSTPLQSPRPRTRSDSSQSPRHVPFYRPLPNLPRPARPRRQLNVNPSSPLSSHTVLQSEPSTLNSGDQGVHSPKLKF